MRIKATMHTLPDGRGAIRVEDLYDTDIDDVWDACTAPDRLARWIAEVSGDLTVGGTFHALFTSTADGSGRVEACEAPRHLLVTMAPDSDETSEIEAWLTSEGTQTRLVIEERGLPTDKLHFYGSGWQVHLEDLGRALTSGASVHPGGWSAERPSVAWNERWTELVPVYEASRTGARP